MSDHGVFAVHRGIFDHPMFAPEPFTEREAWLWMVSAAVWKARRVRAGRKMVDLLRGQLAFSERFLAEKWQWAKSSVRRFLERLKSEAMVTTLADREMTLITICNYEKYAFDGTTREPQNGPPTGPLADHSRTKEEEPKKDNKQEGRKKETREVALVSDFEFEDFWKLWPNKVGKPAAFKAFVSARKRAGLDAIVDGVFAYIRDKPPDRSWLNPATFLNQNRWEDQPATVSISNGKPQNGITQAIKNLNRNIASFDGPAGEADELCGEEGRTPLRLLSNG